MKNLNKLYIKQKTTCSQTKYLPWCAMGIVLNHKSISPLYIPISLVFRILGSLNRTLRWEIMLLASRLQFLAYFCLINEVFMGELVKTPDGNGWFITGRRCGGSTKIRFKVMTLVFPWIVWPNSKWQIKNLSFKILVYFLARIIS